MSTSKGTKGSPAGSNLKPFYIVLAIVAAVGAAALGWSVLGGGRAATEPVALEGVTDPQVLLERANGLVLGEADAPITVIEFGDYQCPACGQWAARIKPLLKAEYIDTGKIRFIFYDFPLLSSHQHAFVAARAARCAADQRRFWDYHDRLYGAQGSWASERNPVDAFVDYAEALGLDVATFESCVKSDEHVEVVSASRELAIQLGVNATPTVIVNGRGVPDPFDYDALKRMIDTELGG